MAIVDKYISHITPLDSPDTYKIKAYLLKNGRTFKVQLDSTNASTAFDGSADIADIGVSGILGAANGGTGNNLFTKDTLIYANTATKLASYTSIKGGTKKLWYLNAGVPTDSTETVGATDKPVFLSSGTITESNSTIGSGVIPIYMASGQIKASTSTVGNGEQPVYLNSGTIAKTTYYLKSNIEDGSANHLAYYSAARTINYTPNITRGATSITIAGSSSAAAQYIVSNGTNQISLHQAAGGNRGIYQNAGDVTGGWLLYWPNGSKEAHIVQSNLIIDSGNLYAGVTSSATERQVHARAAAGDIYLYSQGSASGTRGLYTPAHGDDTSGRYVIQVTANNNAGFADYYNHTITKLAYSQASLADTAFTYPTVWNGYELRTTTKSALRDAIEKQGIHEDYLLWGGHANGTNGWSPIDTVLNDYTRGNGFAGLPAANITVENSTNAGSSWTTTSISDLIKCNLVTNNQSSIRIVTSGNVPNNANPQVRITIKCAGSTYFQLKKIHILISTWGSSGCKVTIKGSLNSAPTTFDQIICNNVAISGWSGWNSITCDETVGPYDGHIHSLQFTFTQTGVSSSYAAYGLHIYNISGYGWMKHKASSQLAEWGHAYTIDGNDNVTFPNTGSVIISKTQDASGTADNKPALIVGGLSTDSHIEIDSNEILAKSNGTTPTTLYLQDTTGTVSVAGSGGLIVSSLTASQAVSTDANKKLVSSNLATTDPSASGSGITYIASISQSAVGKITATKSTVRSASTSQTGVLQFTAANTNTQLECLPTWTATPKDDTLFIRKDTAGTASFGQVKFSTLWTYIKNHITNDLYWANIKVQDSSATNKVPSFSYINLTNTGSNGINFSRTDGVNYLNTPTGGGIGISIGGVAYANCRLILQGDAAFPGKNNTFTLGASGYLWAKGFINEYYLPRPSNVAATDWNTRISANTLYSFKIEELGTSTSNAPTGHWYYSFIGRGADKNYLLQIGFGETVKRVVYRKQTGDTWSGMALYNIPATGPAAIGATTKPIYLDSNGFLQAGTYELKATVNSGTAKQAAYYSAASTISGTSILTIESNHINVTANSNTFSIGSQNANFTHLYNSANIPFIFNKSVLTTAGDLGSNSYPWNNIYLGNSAGTANADIVLHSSKANNTMIRFLVNTSNGDGQGIRIGGGGLTIIGGGESAATVQSGAGFASDSEQMLVANDSSIKFYPNQQSGYTASALIEMTAGRIWAGVNGDTTRENQIGVQSGAGQLYMYSVASTTGTKGIYFAAHGNSPAGYIAYVDSAHRVYYNNNFTSQRVKLIASQSSQINSGVWLRTCIVESYQNYANFQIRLTGNWSTGSPTVATIDVNMRNGLASMKLVHRGFLGVIGKVKLVKLATNTAYLDVYIREASKNTDYFGQFIGNVTVTQNDNTTHGTTNVTTTDVDGLATLDLTTGVGNASTPVYIGADGKPVACTAYGSASVTSATTATRVGDGNIYLYANNSNEINFGGSNTSSTIYFGYRATDSRPKPTEFVFGSKSGNYGSAIVRASQVWGAVWNDYAELRKSEAKTEEKPSPGRVVKENGNDALVKTDKRLERGCYIISDTFGFAIGENIEPSLPVAVSGRVLAYPYESREEFKNHIGWPVCSGPNGTVSIMTEEEEMKYPSRIIGIISAVPDYEIWHGGAEVIVDGRVWIKVR